jgi:preprotein translocase subunit SecA
LVDPYSIRLERVKNVLAGEKEHVLSTLNSDARLRLIDDTMREMEGWACFQPPKPRHVAKPQVHVTRRQAVEQKPKIDRNQPCPCGSGKKYKKCCGANR